MAKKRGRDRSASTRPDAPSPHRALTTVVRPYPTAPLLPAIEDRRTHHPLGTNRPARLVSGHPTKPHVVKPSKFKRQLPFGLRFAAPQQTVICVRRKTRKEVLHALNKTGRGKPRRRPRRNWYSKIGC